MKIIMGENLVYEAPVQVGSHHYARLFSKENEVLWLSLPWNIFLLMRYGFQCDRYLQWNGGKVIDKGNLKLWCPFTFFPYRDNPMLRSLNNIDRSLRYSFPSLRKVLQNNGFLSCDVLWLTDPRMMYLCNMVDYRVLVYRCVDDLSHFKGIPSNIRIAEEKLVKKADIVFATAHILKKRLESYGGKVFSLPNGVDYDFYADYDTAGKTSKIDSMKNVVLYVGTIGEWFDCEFVRHCAEKRPEYNFVIIGPIRTDISSMKGLMNVHLLGSIPYEEVPLYMKKANVGIIPFIQNDLVNAVNPLKLYEYFACGLPVVAAAAYEIRKMYSPAMLYFSYDEALKYLDEHMDNRQGEPLLKDFALENSWQARYSFIMNKIRHRIGGE